MSIKFVLHSGKVISANDKQVHHIPASRLVHLYGLKPKDCILDPKECQLRGYDENELVHLYSLDSGQYRVKLYSELKQGRAKWLTENDSRDGTDCVTPYDEFLY